MNKTRTHSMYAGDQPNICMDIFNMGESAKASRGDAFYEQVREMFLRQSARYLSGNIN